MDENTRRYVESIIDKLMKWEITDTVSWVVADTTFIGEDPREFFLGFWIGRALATATNVVKISEGKVTKQDKKDINKMIGRRLSAPNNRGGMYATI